jgi:hypothetical protein
MHWVSQIVSDISRRPFAGSESTLCFRPLACLHYQSNRSLLASLSIVHYSEYLINSDFYLRHSQAITNITLRQAHSDAQRFSSTFNFASPNPACSSRFPSHSILTGTLYLTCCIEAQTHTLKTSCLPFHTMSQPAYQDCQCQNASIFTGICQKFPNIPESVVISIIFHDFSALDLYSLPLEFGKVTPGWLPHQMQCPQSFAGSDMVQATQPDFLPPLHLLLCPLRLLLRPTYYPPWLFQYLDHLQ